MLDSSSCAAFPAPPKTDPQLPHTPPSPTAQTGAQPPTPKCLACGSPLREGRRRETRCCDGRCRILLSRQKRHAALLDSLARAEEALAAAAAAVEALRMLAQQGPHATATLRLGGSS